MPRPTPARCYNRGIVGTLALAGAKASEAAWQSGTGSTCTSHSAASLCCHQRTEAGQQGVGCLLPPVWRFGQTTRKVQDAEMGVQWMSRCGWVASGGGVAPHPVAAAAAAMAGGWRRTQSGSGRGGRVAAAEWQRAAPLATALFCPTAQANRSQEPRLKMKWVRRQTIPHGCSIVTMKRITRPQNPQKG